MSEPTPNKKDAIAVAMGFMFISIFILGTNPTSLSLVLLLVLPILVAVTSYILTGLILRFFFGIDGEVSRIMRGLVATGFLLAVLLGSLGQFGFQDALLAVLLIGGLVFYLKRLQSARD